MSTIVHYLCDICLARGEEVGAPYMKVKVRLNGSPERVLDLCAQDYQVLAQAPTPETLEPKKRRRVDRRTGPFQCQVRGCGAVLKHTGTMWQHVKGKHDLTLAEYREKYGDPVALTPEELAEAVVEAKCKVKGCGQVYSTELGHRYPQSALVSHMWGRHAIKP